MGAGETTANAFLFWSPREKGCSWRMHFTKCNVSDLNHVAKLDFAITTNSIILSEALHTNNAKRIYSF